MTLWLLAGCVHTPPHPPLAEPVTVRTDRREAVLDADGRECAWEEESLWAGDRRVVGNDPPDTLDWCRAPFDHWRTLDLLGQDGPFVSLRQEDSEGERSCGTLEVTSGAYTTLEAYDPKFAARRTRRAMRLLRNRPPTSGFNPNRFVVGNGHVSFCWLGDDGRWQELDVP